MRHVTAILLVLTLFASMTLTSCKDHENLTGLVVFGAIILAGITFGGWFDDDYDDEFPPDKYDTMSMYSVDGKKHGALIIEGEKDWFRTDLLRNGERMTIWSESGMGLKALLIDEYGEYYETDNAPGSDFNIELAAARTTTYYLMVFGHDTSARGEYEIHWRYWY